MVRLMKNTHRSTLIRSDLSTIVHHQLWNDVLHELGIKSTEIIEIRNCFKLKMIIIYKLRAAQHLQRIQTQAHFPFAVVATSGPYSTHHTIDECKEIDGTNIFYNENCEGKKWVKKPLNLALNEKYTLQTQSLTTIMANIIDRRQLTSDAVNCFKTTTNYKNEIHNGKKKYFWGSLSLSQELFIIYKGFPAKNHTTHTLSKHFLPLFRISVFFSSLFISL